MCPDANMWVRALATVALLLGCQVYTTLACMNYEIAVSKFEVCKGVPSVITFQNFTLTLSEDCRLIPTGCISHKAFTTAMVKYSITKFLLPVGLNGDFDLCDELRNSTGETVAVLQSMKAVTKCPATENQFCFNKKAIVNISEYKEYLQYTAGHIHGDLNIKHNSGTSCLKFDLSIEKKDEKKGIFKNIFKKKKKSRK